MTWLSEEYVSALNKNPPQLLYCFHTGLLYFKTTTDEGSKRLIHNSTTKALKYQLIFGFLSEVTSDLILITGESDLFS